MKNLPKLLLLIVPFSFFFAAPVFAITYDNSAVAGIAGASSSFSYTNNGDAMVLCVTGATAGSVSADFDGDNFIQAQSASIGFGFEVEEWYLLNPHIGAHTLTVNNGSVRAYGYAIVSSYAGVDSVGASNNNEVDYPPGASSISVINNTTTDGSLNVDCLTDGGGSLPTVTGANQSAIQDNAGASGFYAASSDQTTSIAGSYTVGWSLGSTQPVLESVLELIAGSTTPPTPTTTPSSLGSTTIVDNPTQDVTNGFILFFIGFLTIVWFFRRTRE